MMLAVSPSPRVALASARTVVPSQTGSAAASVETLTLSCWLVVVVPVAGLSAAAAPAMANVSSRAAGRAAARLRVRDGKGDAGTTWRSSAGRNMAHGRIEWWGSSAGLLPCPSGIGAGERPAQSLGGTEGHLTLVRGLAPAFARLR